MKRFREDLLSGKTPPRPISDFGLKGRRTVVVSEGHCGVLIDRKSRYLRKDALGFLEIKKAVEQRLGAPHRGLVLLRTAPLCSKAKSLLEESGVVIEVVSQGASV